MAQGEMASGESSSAAALFDEYTLHADATWETHFARGVAHANARGGRESNIAALRAYNEALALAPDDLDTDSKARVHAYRGAILKRLVRLDEAQPDLVFALRLARSMYERDDALYNLAGVYALKGDRAQMLSTVAAITDRRTYGSAIRAHFDDYFAQYAGDPELLALIR